MKIDLSKIKEGDIFSEESHYTVKEIWSDKIIFQHLEGNEEVVLCRDINISSNSPYYNKVGYFVEVYDKHRVFRITEDSLKDFRIWVGYDEKFALEERIKTLQGQLKTLQDRLARLKEMKSEKA